jgi:RimJ/RimL family protein N-acetyltransferase
MNSENHSIFFEKASLKYQPIIFEWLAEPHFQEFWDNSQEHKDDIINFINGRKQPSNYFYGTTIYWVGLINDQPFCFLLSDILLAFQKDLSDLHKSHLSRTGNTISIDFGIGNKAYLGKGLAAPTLQAFIKYYRVYVDPKADTFFIDPDENNPKAQHVYAKAGFEHVGNYLTHTEIINDQKTFFGVFNGHTTHLMVKHLDEHSEI